jgi:hypothetical protein
MGNLRYRDSVFRDYFNEPVRLMDLCSAVLDSQFSNVSELEINTLQGSFFSAIKNDISCKIGNSFLVLIEHQSTINENMPFRCLSYVTELLNNMAGEKSKFYSRQRVEFPVPKFFVLYDGDEIEPLTRTMKLSDAFGGDNSSLELIVNSYNINFGLNQPLLKKCHYLNEYSTLVGKVKEGRTAGLNRRIAIREAINWCIVNNVMKEYLSSKKEEVFTMLDWQWDINEAKTVWQEEARIEGETQKAEKIAIKMLRRGKSWEEVSEDTELPIQRVQELSQSIDSKM